MKRTFSKEEAQWIIADAAEGQLADTRPAHEHLALHELEEAAAFRWADPRRT